MTINLADYESGARYHGDYSADLAIIQDRLERILTAYIVHGRRAVIMLEGWDAAGKDGIIERLTSGWSQGHYEVYPIGAPSAQEAAHHFLWRFRTRLPGPGQIVIFDRSWYGRVLVEKVEALSSPEDLEASYGEINTFETGLAEDDITLVKIFLHITQEEQDKRLRARIKDPWKRWKTGINDFKNRSHRAGYLEAMAVMFARTDTEAGPWFAIDGDNKKAARIAALEIIADRLEAAVPMDPPALDPEIAVLAQNVLGIDVSNLDQ
ncbi:polyphosphate kinase [Sphingomonas sp. BIUV-7]|uniref:Polyphosphate kinase n=1 Tax=Sphingomonas natans TaxID=3063330 RepID=A0ABT8Y8J5_9SPHN|nr:polyphosphate kinase [Sphingomonas sp. BIUV-7]MDO6414653.1 polyphosphate kinase [Sphingomonas sp. BIUV-7]